MRPCRRRKPCRCCRALPNTRTAVARARIKSRIASWASSGTIVTDKVNEMWGTDMSQTVTLEERRACVFVAVEHVNSEIVGIYAARSANRFEALEPVRQGCIGASAPSRPGVARGLKLRHDHGSNYMSGDFQDEIKCLDIEASPSFVRQPEGNGVAERFGDLRFRLAVKPYITI